MKKLSALLVLVFSAFGMFAQSTVDKEMTLIARNPAYISADVRASTEHDAREDALDKLADLVENYFHGFNTNMSVREYINIVKPYFETLSSQTNTNRYRVLAYVKKSDLNLGGSMGPHSGGDSSPSQSSMAQKPGLDIPAPVMELAKISNGDLVASRLQQLRKDNQISGAAAFPIGKFGDFYVLLINPLNEVETILYFDGYDWWDVVNGETLVNPSNYKNYKAFWFTL